MRPVKKKYQHWLPLFKAEVTDKAQQIDPDSELHWLALTVGWALAKGMSPDEANEFAVEVRYRTDLA
jgi:hypothetical protein